VAARGGLPVRRARSLPAGLRAPRRVAAPSRRRRRGRAARAARGVLASAPPAAVRAHGAVARAAGARGRRHDLGSDRALAVALRGREDRRAPLPGGHGARDPTRDRPRRRARHSRGPRARDVLERSHRARGLRGVPARLPHAARRGRSALRDHDRRSEHLRRARRGRPRHHGDRRPRPPACTARARGHPGRRPPRHRIAQRGARRDRRFRRVLRGPDARPLRLRRLLGVPRCGGGARIHGRHLYRPWRGERRARLGASLAELHGRQPPRSLRARVRRVQ